MCIQGGYRTQTVVQLANICTAFSVKKISLKAVRIYFASLAIVAAREAAERANAKRSKQPKENHRRFLLRELARLSGVPMPQIRSCLRALEQAGLLLFSETEISFTDSPLPGSYELLETFAGERSPKRPIPIPRPMLRFLARTKKAAVIQTLITYLVRGLSISRRGEISNRGSVKASWIAEVTGLSIRSVKSARGILIQLGLISDDIGSTQRKLNRSGAYFEINLEWSAPQTSEADKVTHNGSAAGVKEVPSLAPIVDNFASKFSNFAPPPSQNCSNFAPPYKYKKTPYGLKNQKTQESLKPSGFCRSKEEISLKDIQQEDLKRVSSLSKLYEQATKARWLEASEANFRNFVGAAVRATRIGQGDAIKVFVSIIKRNLWHYITQEQEDRAQAVIKRYREKQERKDSQAQVKLSELLGQVLAGKSKTAQSEKGNPNSYLTSQ